MNTFTLKIIALITMLIDHIGSIFFPEMLFLRFIGRLAFPIYAFLLVQGYLHTTNTPKFKKYISRMALFAFISEISFDLCFYQKPIYLGYQNVYFTLLLGLLALYTYELLEKKNKDGFYSILAFSVLAFLLKSDYNVIGIIFIFMFYFNEKWKQEKKNPKLQKRLFTLMFVILTLIEIVLNSYSLEFKALIISFTQYTWAYLGILLAMPLISKYNGQLGLKTKTTQLIFYWFYPVHLTIIYFINYLLMSR